MLNISKADVFAGLTDGRRGLLAAPGQGSGDDDDGPPGLDDDGPPGLDDYGLEDDDDGGGRTPGRLLKQGTMGLFGSMAHKIENIAWDPPATPRSPDSGIKTPDTPSSAASEQDEGMMGWLEEQNHNLNESSKLHGSAVLTDGSTAQESVKASAILSKGEDGMPTFEMPESLGTLTEDWATMIGDTTGLSSVQCTARRMLKARRQMRSAEAGLIDIFMSEQYKGFVAEFDAMIKASQHREAPEMVRGEALPLMMQMQQGHRETALLESEEFWGEVDDMERQVTVDVRVLKHAEAMLQQEIALMKQEMVDERDRELHQQAAAMASSARMSRVIHTEALLEEMSRVESVESKTLSFEEEDEWEEDDSTKQRRLLVEMFPELQRPEFLRRYAEQRIFCSHPGVMVPPDPLPDKGHIIEIAAANEHAKLMVRDVLAFHEKTAVKERTKEAKAQGAIAPRGHKPETAMIRARLAFPGPIFGKREAPDQESMEDNDPLLVKGAGGILHVRDIEGHIPGSMFVPAGKPDTCPTPPKLPSRMDLARASRKSPGFTFKAKSMQDRANFLARYGPIKYGSGVPKPPPPPQAKKYFPLPWEQLPAHKLKMRGLPMVCTEDDILAFLGKHAADVQDIVREGFKKGIKIFKLADRWLTGEAHLVMKSRRAALDTILYMDKKIMGRRVIHLDYLIEEIPVPRGRIMLGGIHRRTTENDLEEFFRGWDLVAEEGQGPEIFGDIQGEPTGDALVIFETVEASDTVLRLFDFSQRLRGVELTYEPMLPMKFDPVAEKWEDMDVFMPSTVAVLTMIAEQLGISPEEFNAGGGKSEEDAYATPKKTSRRPGDPIPEE